jgi:osmoprotectant transport system ATP-binding protein
LLISLDKVSKKYGTHSALADATLAFPAGTTTALIGPSGCGKSTLLRTVVGLVWPDSGMVYIGGEPLRQGNANRLRHRMGYVIQAGGLFPHLSARDNVTLLARHLVYQQQWISTRLAQLLELMQLEYRVLAQFPDDLSGGQRQRVSLMRALMLDPPILLLDEPLGALDPVTRFKLQDELKTLFAILRKTVLLVTHDMAEAAYLSDKIVMMKAGVVLQEGSPAALLNQPSDPYVREFISARRTLPGGA